MKIYTRTGDTGTTSLVGGSRVSKASTRLEAYGTVDELNSHIGLLLACDGVPQSVRETLITVQHRLFNIGSQLATPPDSKWQPEGVNDTDVEALERAIDEADTLVPKFKKFLLPGGSFAAAQANVARTVARRAERRIIAMAQEDIEVDSVSIRYINRLSDYLFIAGRLINVANGTPEIFWQK